MIQVIEGGSCYMLLPEYGHAMSDNALLIEGTRDQRQFDRMNGYRKMFYHDCDRVSSSATAVCAMEVSKTEDSLLLAEPVFFKLEARSDVSRQGSIHSDT